jgi:hypothetical protein
MRKKAENQPAERGRIFTIYMVGNDRVCMTLRWSGQDSNFESLHGKLVEPMTYTGLSALGPRPWLTASGGALPSARTLMPSGRVRSGKRAAQRRNL